MNGSRRLLLAGMIALAGVCTGGAMADRPPDPLATIRTMDDLRAAGPDNAALVYYRAILSMHGVEDMKIREAMRGGDGSEMTREKAVRALEGLQGLIDSFCRAAAMETCDFGPDFDQGFELLVPHLGRMRAAARLIVSDAERLAEQGEADAAAHRVAALYGIARHLSGEWTLISALVGVSIAAFANEGAAQLVEAGEMTDAGRDAIVAAIERLGTSDQFYMRRSVSMEGAILRVWLKDLITNDGIERIIGFLGSGVVPKPDFSDLRALSHAEAIAAVDRAVEYYEHTLSVWDKPDAADRLGALSMVVQSGGYGPIGRHVCASVHRVHESDQRIRAELAATLDSLRAYRPARAETVAPPR